MPPAAHQDDAHSPLSGSTPLWIAARRLLKEYGREFFRRWKKTADGFSIEDIHDLRVASRRLREGLLLFEPCFGDGKLAAMAKRVKRVTTVLGELRNTDEAILFFSQLTSEERTGCGPDLEEMLDHLKTEALAARRKLEDDLRALRPGPLKARLKADLAAPLLFGNDRTDPFQPISRYADGAIAVRGGAVAELLPPALDEANAAAQHRLRIAVKRLRYRLEILQELFGSHFPDLQSELKGYQELLGKLHDLDVFSALALERVPVGAAQQTLLRAITDRRSAGYASFRAMLEVTPPDAISGKARSLL